MQVVKSIIILIGIQLVGYTSLAQEEVEQISNASSFKTISTPERHELNDSFKEINPFEMTFKPTFEVDSEWVLLDEYSILDLDMGDVEIIDEDKYYGIGRYAINGITYYFVAMPIPDSGWGISVFAQRGGKFTDAYMIAFGNYDSGEDINQFGWVEEVKKRNEVIFITRTHLSYQDRGGEENSEVIEELQDCEVYCLREGEFAPYTRMDTDQLNKKYKVDLHRSE